MTGRRQFLRHGGMAVALAPVIGAKFVVDIGKPPVPVLPPVQAGELLTAQRLNDMVDAINELRAGAA